MSDDCELEDEKKRARRDKSGMVREANRRYEFDCPECDANNPWDEGFRDGDEVRCHYCGQELLAKFVEGDKLKLKAV